MQSYFPFLPKIALSGKFLHCHTWQILGFSQVALNWTAHKGWCRCITIISTVFYIFILRVSPLNSIFPFYPLYQGLQSLTPTTRAVAGKPAGDSYQLLVAVVGSVTVTCVTILLALLALFFIRKTLLNRRRTFTYQSGSVRKLFSIALFRNTDLTKCNLFVLKRVNITPGWRDYSAV